MAPRRPVTTLPVASLVLPGFWAGLLFSSMPGLGDVGLLVLTGPGWHWEKELSLCFTAPDAIPLQSAFQGCWLSGRICSTGPLSEHEGCSSRGERGPVG